MVQMKEKNQTSEKGLKKNGDNLLDVAFKTLIIRMFNKFSEDFNSIKMNQSEVTGVLTEI